MKTVFLRVATPNLVEVLTVMKDRIGKVFPNTLCMIAEEVMPMPQQAYNIRRNQYYSSLILSEVHTYAEKLDCDRVLGVTEVDLCAPQLNFVFGEAEFNGKAALISTHRLEPEFYGKLPSQAVFCERSMKEAIHEIGHTLGLKHCYDGSCVMFFSNSIIDTDRKKPVFCEKCGLIVNRKLMRINEKG